jgi:soluble lytic murein transglycosylase-like protein
MSGVPLMGGAQRVSRRSIAVVGFVFAFSVLMPKTVSAEEVVSSSQSRFAGVAELNNLDAKTGSSEAVAKSESSSTPAPDARASYRTLIEKEAKREGLAPDIAEAVMAVESGYNAGAIGGAGEIGLMQILPSTARMLGFSGSNADLAAPEANIHYGVTYLAQAWRLAGGDLCTAVMKYRAGHGETRFSYLSVNYCLAVRAKLAARGYHVTGIVPVATFGEATRGAAGCKHRCLAGGMIGSVNLAALNTQLSSLAVQMRARAVK